MKNAHPSDMYDSKPRPDPSEYDPHSYVNTYHPLRLVLVSFQSFHLNIKNVHVLV